MGTMQVILAENIPNLGEVGDTVSVKGGYGRNFLIPQGKALLASTTSASNIAHRMKQIQDQRKRQIKTEQDLADSLSNTEVRIAVKVGEEDRVFGSVTSQNISAALAEKGFDVDRRKVVLEEPIRALGVYTVQVRLNADVVGDLKVRVVKEG